MSDEQKKKIGLANKGRRPSDNCISAMVRAVYKGDDAGVSAKHIRIANKFGRPNYCEICKRTDKKLYEWANKDHRYSNKKEDWMRLCRGCHMKYDYKNGHRKHSAETKEKISRGKKFNYLLKIYLSEIGSV